MCEEYTLDWSQSKVFLVTGWNLHSRMSVVADFVIKPNRLYSFRINNYEGIFVILLKYLVTTLSATCHFVLATNTAILLHTAIVIRMLNSTPPLNSDILLPKHNGIRDNFVQFIN